MRRAAPQRAVDRLIVALDVTSLATALAMARKLRGVAKTVKIGSVLFTACGPLAVQRLRALGFNVMLDLKFLDIPSTVELSCRAAVRQRVSMLTVHAASSNVMLRAAAAGVRAEAARLHITRPLVLGITVLTSVDRRASASVSAQVIRLAAQALTSGCDGVVASAQEARPLRRRFGKRLKIFCPGIRPAGTQANDQQRVCTPREALRRGAEGLIIGRPITMASRPRAAVKRILNEMEAVNEC